jgi:hypothetical protein
MENKNGQYVHVLLKYLDVAVEEKLRSGWAG